MLNYLEQKQNKTSPLLKTPEKEGIYMNLTLTNNLSHHGLIDAIAYSTLINFCGTYLLAALLLAPSMFKTVPSSTVIVRTEEP